MRLVLRRDVENPDRYSLFLLGDDAAEGREIRIWSGEADIAWQLARIGAIEIHGGFDVEPGAAWNAADEVGGRQFVIEIDHDATAHTGCLVDLELTFEDRQPVRLPIWRGGDAVAKAFFRAASAYGEAVVIRRPPPPAQRETPVELLLRLEQRAAWFDYMKRAKRTTAAQASVPERLTPQEMAVLQQIAAENFARFGRDGDVDTLLAEQGALLTKRPATALRILLKQRSMLEKAQEETV